VTVPRGVACRMAPSCHTSAEIFHVIEGLSCIFAVVLLFVMNVHDSRGPDI
jgi:hypothetical protein